MEKKTKQSLLFIGHFSNEVTTKICNHGTLIYFVLCGAHCNDFRKKKIKMKNKNDYSLKVS